MKTLLLPYTPDLAEQVQDARCRHDIAEFWDFGMFYFCRIKSAGIREDVPDWVKRREEWGCIAIDTAPLRACASDFREPYQSYVLFHPAYCRTAWSIARMLAGSHERRPAVLIREDLGRGIFIFVASKHRAITRGEELA